MANSEVDGSEPPGAGQPYGTRPAAYGSSAGVTDEPAAPSVSVGDAVLFVLASVLVGGLLSVPAALVWDKVANPPRVRLTKQGAFLGEVQLNQQAEVTLWFLVVGLASGLLAGLVVGWFGQRRGVVTVVAVLAMCAVASTLTGYLGMSVFGPDVRAQVASAGIGASITESLKLGSKLVYLGWPIGGMLGAVVAIFLWPVPANDAS